ncbi:hypothetical protein SUGI_0007920 [Cryptomeria japonica]|nr:hypothetical protein SUGI_0007920 [Cryptomeria japonica]
MRDFETKIDAAKNLNFKVCICLCWDLLGELMRFFQYENGHQNSTVQYSHPVIRRALVVVKELRNGAAIFFIFFPAIFIQVKLL